MKGWQKLALVGGVAYLIYRASRAAPAGSTVVDLMAGKDKKPSKFDDYIRYLYDRQVKMLPKLKKHYNIDRMRRITRAVARYYAVPPEWIWGIAWGESKWTPVGIYAHNPDKAIAKRSNAYGIGQFLRGRFRSEKKRQPGSFRWDHDDLVEPRIALWSIGGSLHRALKRRGGGRGATMEAQRAAIGKFGRDRSGLAVGHWWAGYGTTPEGKEKALRGARKKVRHIKAYGPNVYASGKAKGSKTPGGPTSAVDDRTPWGEASKGVLFADTLSDPGKVSKEEGALALQSAKDWLAIADSIVAAHTGVSPKGESDEPPAATPEGELELIIGEGEIEEPGVSGLSGASGCGLGSCNSPCCTCPSRGKACASCSQTCPRLEHHPRGLWCPSRRYGATSCPASFAAQQRGVWPRTAPGFIHAYERSIGLTRPLQRAHEASTGHPQLYWGQPDPVGLGARPESHVQSLLFDRDQFSRGRAKDWAAKHGQRYGSVHETENHWRLRQDEPGDYRSASFRTVPLTEGVKAVIGDYR